MRRVRIPFVHSNCDIPVVPCTLSNGATGLAIVDTGSDVSLIDKQFILNNKKEFKVEMSEDKANFSGLTTTQEVPVITAETQVRFTKNSKRFRLKADVFPLDFAQAMSEAYDICPDILLGSDILKQLNAEISYEKRELVLHYDDLSCKQ